MKRTIALLALLLLLSSVPSSSGRHFSLGAEDGIGVEASESPDDPSVPQDAYDRATRTDCFSGGRLTVEQTKNATRADGLCGELVYHQDLENLTHPSSTDQDLHPRIGTFDVLATHLAGSYPSPTCWPFCSGPVGDPLWTLTHDVGGDLGLTDEPDQANRKENDGRLQEVTVNLYYPSASRMIQQEAGAWEMNGWLMPSAMRSYVGFLEDADGDPISKTELETMVSELVDSGDLHPETVPTICGFIPDLEFSLALATGYCEFPMHYQDPGSGSADFKDGYQDECESPTYACGFVNGPAWYATVPCLATASSRDQTIASQATPPGYGRTRTCGGSPNTDYLQLHWFVAPHASRCSGAQAPGASFRTDRAAYPYLAHDLDVYTPATSLRTAPETRTVPSTVDHLDHAGRRATSDPGAALDPALALVNDSVPAIPAVPGQVDEALSSTAYVLKEDRVEPNADPVGSLEDTSQHLVRPDGPLQRSLDGACEVLLSSETADTVDPWVDLIDSQANEFGTLDTIQTSYATVENPGVYGNSDPRQDDTNHPGPGLFTLDGKVGLFTDKDDDGVYDQAPFNDRYDPETIQAVGAYPMLWDMWVDGDGEVSTSKGCTASGTSAEGRFPEIMADAGYGPTTGIVQAVYLREPTVFTDLGDGTSVPYPSGNNIYLLMSQAPKHFYHPDVPSANPLDARIDEIVSTLTNYAKQTGDVSGSVGVKFPGNALGFASDYSDQCGSAQTGTFLPKVQFLHACQVDCAGDTIVTMYAFELTRGTVGGDAIPPFSPGNEPYEFGEGQHAWYDVDPFDGDPERNTEDRRAPPT